MAGVASSIFSLDGVTSILQAGFGWIAYNRDSYADNVAMRQNQLYQEKNYHISWIAIARDDIRDIMQTSVGRFNNYMIVATLIFSVSAAALIEADVPEETEAFIRHAFFANLTLSVVYFALSIMFCVKGSKDAFNKSVDLLTLELRPDHPDPYNFNYMKQCQQFEKSARTAFRIPLIRPLWNIHNGLPPVKESLRKPVLSALTNVEPGHQRQKRNQAETLTNSSERDTAWYFERFRAFQDLWRPFEEAAQDTLGHGIVALSHASAYYSLGKFHDSHQMWATTFTLCLVFIYLSALLYYSTFEFDKTWNEEWWGRRLRFTAFTALVMGPLCAALALRLDGMDGILVPASFFAHVLLAVLSFLRDHIRIRRANEELSTSEPPNGGLADGLKTAEQPGRLRSFSESADYDDANVREQDSPRHTNPGGQPAEFNIFDNVHTSGITDLCANGSTNGHRAHPEREVQFTASILPAAADPGSSCIPSCFKPHTFRHAAEVSFGEELGVDVEHGSRPSQSSSASSARPAISHRKRRDRNGLAGPRVDPPPSRMMSETLQYDIEMETETDLSFRYRQDDESMLVDQVQSYESEMKYNLVLAKGQSRLAHIVVALTWLSLMFESIFSTTLKQIRGQQAELNQDLRQPECSRAKFVETLAVRWPSPFFRPRVLACSDEHIFVADEFRIFEMISGLLIPVQCKLTGTMADVTVSCEHRTCKVLAVSSGPAAEVINCSDQTQLPLLQTADAPEKITVGQDAAAVHTLVGGRLLEFQRSLERGGLQPFWQVAMVFQKHIHALDVLGDQLVVFHDTDEGTSLIDVQHLGQQHRTGCWVIPRDLSPVVSGCSLGNTSNALILVDNGQSAPRIARLILP